MKTESKKKSAKVGKATPAKVTPKAAKKSATVAKPQQGAKKSGKATAAKKSRKG